MMGEDTSLKQHMPSVGDCIDIMTNSYLRARALIKTKSEIDTEEATDEQLDLLEWYYEFAESALVALDQLHEDGIFYVQTLLAEEKHDQLPEAAQRIISTLSQAGAKANKLLNEAELLLFGAISDPVFSLIPEDANLFLAAFSSASHEEVAQFINVMLRRIVRIEAKASNISEEKAIFDATGLNATTRARIQELIDSEGGIAAGVWKYWEQSFLEDAAKRSTRVSLPITPTVQLGSHHRG